MQWLSLALAIGFIGGAIFLGGAYLVYWWLSTARLKKRQEKAQIKFKTKKIPKLREQFYGCCEVPGKGTEDITREHAVMKNMPFKEDK